jgi:hypothetical protein
MFMVPVRLSPLPIWFALFFSFSPLGLAQGTAAVNEPMRDNYLFRQRFELRLDPTFSKFVDGMTRQSEMERAIELERANRSVFSKLLEYTRFIPYRVRPEVDTFFLQNYLRVDLNPKPHEGEELFNR